MPVGRSALETQFSLRTQTITLVDGPDATSDPLGPIAPITAFVREQELILAPVARDVTRAAPDLTHLGPITAAHLQAYLRRIVRKETLLHAYEN
jgi:hypothetical protein